MLFFKKKKQIKISPLKSQNKPIEKTKIETALEKSNPIPKNEKSFKKSEIPTRIDRRKEFMDGFKRLTYRHQPWQVWNDLVVMSACSIANAVDKHNFDKREKRYLSIIKKYIKKDQEVFPKLLACIVMALDENPEQDFLGSIFMELNLGNKLNGQFFTPYHVCQLMADMAVGNPVPEIKEKGYISINDPCCGAGATLIAGIHSVRKVLEKEKPPLNYQNHVLVVAQEIDEMVTLMCYIQISLLGVAGYVKIGNSLSDPITTKDNPENYWYTPMYFSDVWVCRRMAHTIFEEGTNE